MSYALASGDTCVADIVIGAACTGITVQWSRTWIHTAAECQTISLNPTLTCCTGLAYIPPVIRCTRLPSCCQKVCVPPCWRRNLPQQHHIISQHCAGGQADLAHDCCSWIACELWCAAPHHRTVAIVRWTPLQQRQNLGPMAGATWELARDLHPSEPQVSALCAPAPRPIEAGVRANGGQSLPVHPWHAPWCSA